MDIQNFPTHIAYYKNLHLLSSFNGLIHRFRGQSIVYGIRCRITNMIYIGSTTNPIKRFNKHLVTGEKSNDRLQNAINKHGLEWFTVYVFESFKFDPKQSRDQRVLDLRKVEQKYIDMFPKSTLYNYINSVSETNS